MSAGILAVLALVTTVDVVDGPSAGDAKDTLVGRTADGTEVWRWTLAEFRDVGGPYEIGASTVVTVRNDLIEIDPATGHVIARTRFPAKIVDVVPIPGDEPRANITIEPEGFVTPERPDPLLIEHHLGEPARGKAPLGGFIGWFRNSVPVEDLRPPSQTHTPKLAAEAAIAELERVLPADPTDVWRRFDLGRWHASRGRDAEAHAAYRDAATLTGAPWQDLLRLSAELDAIEARDEATLAYQRGKAGYLAAGIDPRRMQSAIGFMILNGPRWRAIEAATKAGDAERVHLLATRGWELHPRLEGGDVTWTTLAGWFESHGRPDLATTWRERAREAGQGFLNRIRSTMLARLHVTGAIADGLMAGGILAAFLIGARAARRRTRLVWHDVILLAAPALLLLGVVDPLTRRAIAPQMAAMYSGPTNDDFAAPEHIRALERSPASATRDRVLAYARAEQQALRDGVRSTATPPTEDDLVTAVSVIPPELPTKTDRPETMDDAWSLDSWFLGKGNTLRFFWLFAVFALGYLGARLLPALGAPGLGPASGVVAGLFVAGLYGLLRRTPLDHFLRYFGLDDLGEHAYAPAPTLWAWLTLAATTLLFIYGVNRARTRVSPGHGSPDPRR